jgi:hypothetical protein
MRFGLCVCDLIQERFDGSGDLIHGCVKRRPVGLGLLAETAHFANEL